MHPTLKLLMLTLSLGISGAASARGLEIVEAWYGVGDRVCDAAWAVSRQCRGSSCEVYASNDLCGDPRSGREKVLSVVYACGRETRRADIAEYGVGVLSCRGQHRNSNYRPAFRDSPRRQRGGGLEVLEATYGSRHRACDATPAAADFCQGRSECAIPADNHLCGDPHRGERKSLFVEYSCGSRSRQASAREDGEVILSCR